MAKSIIDYIAEEDYPRYEELIALAEQAKSEAPKKERAPRAPMTAEQKKKAAEIRLAKAQEALARLLAAEQNVGVEA